MEENRDLDWTQLYSQATKPLDNPETINPDKVKEEKEEDDDLSFSTIFYEDFEEDSEAREIDKTKSG